jgi:hypothetical protein
MGCQVIRMKDGTTALVCGRGKYNEPCHYCHKPSTSMCDHPVFRMNKKETCDTPMCDDCKNIIGDNLDLCRSHFNFWRNNGKKFVLGGEVIT